MNRTRIWEGYYNTAFPCWVRYSLPPGIKGTELKAEGRRQKRPIDKLFILLRTGFALHPSSLQLVYLKHSLPVSTLAQVRLFLGSLLLTSNRASTASTGASVGASALPSYRQPSPMTSSSVGANIHQAFDVHGFPSPQVPFDLVVAFDDFPQSGDVGIGKVSYAGIRINPRFTNNLFGPGQPNAIDISQSNFDAFIPGKVNACYPCHRLFSPLVCSTVNAYLPYQCSS